MLATANPEVLQEKGLFRRGMRLVWLYIRLHPRPFLVSVAGAAVFAIASIGLTSAIAHVSDTLLRPAFAHGVTTRQIALACLVILFTGGLRAAGIMVRRYYSGVGGERVMATLRTRVSDRYRELALSFHRGTPTGELLAHMEADVKAAVDVYWPVPFAVGVIFLVILAIAQMLATDLYLAMTGLVLFPTLILMNRSFAKRMEGPAERAQQKIGEVSAVAHESIDGALVVKTLGRERTETERLGVRARQLRDERVAAGFIRATFEAALDALPVLAIALLLAVGAWRVSTGDVSPGDLIGFVALFGLLSWPMRFIGWILAELPRAVVSYDRLERVFAEPVTVTPPEHPRPLPEGPVGIETRDLGLSFEGQEVLDGVSLSIHPQESVAIVGETGSGKSTLAELMVRLADPDRGSVLIGGVDLREAEPASLRRTAAIVFQESFLFSTSIEDNIALDSGAAHEQVVASARIASADRFIRTLPQGYSTVVGERGHTLSGGERQRVALARALVRSPRILILDDATSAVDPSIEAEILGALRRELRTTLVLIAYRLSTIKLADRVLYLEDGRIAGSGSHEDLLRDEPGYAGIIRAYERAER